MTARTTAARVMRVRDGVAGWRADRLAAEAPLEIRIAGEPLATTMRTPGDDFDLAVGFLLSEGVVSSAAQVRTITTCEVAQTGEHNILDVDLLGGTPPDALRARRLLVSSACGVCGTASIEEVLGRRTVDVSDDPLVLSPALLARLPETLRAGQRAFESTGGLHAAALFDAAGGLVCVREDVGRHNAFDKVIGWAARQGMLPLRSHVILASGRASFELTQKALIAGIPCLAAVSAPSSLAVDLAAGAGMTLVGFLRGTTMNVYAGHHRVRSDEVSQVSA